jgi:hypothetical protein
VGLWPVAAHCCWSPFIHDGWVHALRISCPPPLLPPSSTSCVCMCASWCSLSGLGWLVFCVRSKGWGEWRGWFFCEGKWGLGLLCTCDQGLWGKMIWENPHQNWKAPWHKTSFKAILNREVVIF